MAGSRGRQSSERDFAAGSEALPVRLVAGLSKIGMALKSKASKHAPAAGVSPTQAQILVQLQDRPDGQRLSQVAESLGITLATASEAASSLAGKKLIKRLPDPADRRASRLSLTRQGRSAAERVSDWPDFMLKAVDALDPAEQAVFLRALVKMIRALQDNGEISVQAMCATCRYFRPFAHAGDAVRPHHCAFVDAPFGDTQIRLDCRDHVPAEIEQRNHQWARWLAGATPHPTT